MDWFLLLQQSGLPVVKACEEVLDNGKVQVNAVFERGLSDTENNIFLELTAPEKLRKKLAKTKADAVPDWIKLGENEALAYIDGNTGNVADMRKVVKAMARLLLAIYDASDLRDW